MAQEQGSYEGLARKYRPLTFEDLVGQENVARSLQNALRANKTAHGHLLTGPRGVGKTTTARIMAKALNCEQGPTPTPCGVCSHCREITGGSHMDVIEIDAASHRKIENVRDLRERVVQSPFSARFKVYIIDEVHMLTPEAFNALLKTLEEPPPHVIFILATTEYDKIPETIRSRCMQHQLRRLGAEDIVRRLQQVTEREGVAIDEHEARDIFGLIARAVEGGMRDALVTYDQLLAITEGKPTIEAALGLLGLAERTALIETVRWLSEGKAPELLGMIESLVERGRNLERFVKELVAYLRDLMLLQAGAGDELVSLTGETLTEAHKQAGEVPDATLFNMLNHMFELEEKLKQSTQARFLIEFTFLRLAAIKPVVPLDDIIRRVQALPEAALGSTPAPSSQPVQKSAPANQQTQPASTSSLPREAAPQAPTPRPKPAVGLAARPTSAPLAFNDAAAEPTPAPVAANTVAENELIGRLLEELPETMGYLGRYLNKCSEVNVDGGSVTMTWPAEDKLSPPRIAHPDNLPIIEEALSRVLGRTARLRCENSSKPSAQPRAAQSMSAAPSRSALPSAGKAAVSAEAPPVLGDSQPADPAMDPLGPSPAMYDAYEERLPTEEEIRALTSQAAKSKSVTTGKAAEELANKLLSSSEDVAKRIRMMKDMFNGSFIGEDGEPLSI